MKILDFGLAKRVGGAPEDQATSAPTMSRQTDPGTVMGTVGYMSPEQVRGPVDHRSDLFAFGAILYEMLSGKRAFRRDTASDTMSAILRDDPPELLESGRNVPPALDRIVRHCLEKNPSERFQSARDIAFDLEAVSGASTSGAARARAVTGPRFRLRPAAFVGAIALLAAGALLDRVLRRTPDPPLVAVRPLTQSGKDFLPAISPDGKTMAFCSMRDGKARIWLKDLSSGGEVGLTEGSDVGPRFSPDGSQLLFNRGVPAFGPPTPGMEPDLYRVPLIGGTPRKIAGNAGDADWSPDGKTIVFIRFVQSPLATVLLTASPDGGEPKEIARLPGRFAYAPRFSPDGGRVAVVSISSLSNSGSRVDILAADGSTRRSLPVPGSLAGISAAVWDPTGRNIFFAQWLQVRFGASRLLRMDARSGRVTPLVWLASEVLALDGLGPGRLVANSATSRQNLAEIDLANPAAMRCSRGNEHRSPARLLPRRRVGRLLVEPERKPRHLGALDEDRSDPATDGRRRRRLGSRLHARWKADLELRSDRAPRDLERRSRRRLAAARDPGGHGCREPHGHAGRLDRPCPDELPKQGLWKIRPDGSLPRDRSGLNIPETSPDGRYVACPDIPVGPVRVVRIADATVVPFQIDVPHSRTAETSLGRVRWSIDGKRTIFSAGRERRQRHFHPGPDPQGWTRAPPGAGGLTRTSRPNLRSLRMEAPVVAFLERLYGIVTIEGVPGAGRKARSN